MKGGLKKHATPSERVEFGKTFTSMAYWFAESVAEFYQKGLDHDPFQFTEDYLFVHKDLDSRLVHSVTYGRVLNVLSSPTLMEWDTHQVFFGWTYDITFHLTADGMVGDIVVYSDWGVSFFFSVIPRSVVKLKRIKATCFTCISTASSCACA